MLGERCMKVKVGHKTVVATVFMMTQPSFIVHAIALDMAFAVS